MTTSIRRAAAVALWVAIVPAVAAKGGGSHGREPAPPTAAEAKARRAELRRMCDKALAALYRAKPQAKSEVAKAAGYGCFSSFGISFLVGGAGGHGLVHSNKTGKNTYMKMAQASGGIDFGVKKYREVLVFQDAKTLAQFTDNGWEISGGGSASAAVDGKGGSVDTTEVPSGAIVIYPMTDTGLTLGAAAAGRKYWKDASLGKRK